MWDKIPPELGLLIFRYLSTSDLANVALACSHWNFLANSAIEQEMIIPEISSVIASSYTTFLLNESGQMYACGFNKWGQLGLNDNHDRHIPTRIPILRNERVKHIEAEEGKTFILTASGDVYGCGSNDYGILGLGDNQHRNTFTLLPLPSDDKVKAITLKKNTFYALTVSGKLYGSGYNHHGELGLGDTYHRNTLMLLPVPDNQRVRSLAAIENSTFILTESGSVYCCGDNYYGQLGLKGRGIKKYFTLLPIPNNEIVRNIFVSVGQRLFVLTESNKIYGSGYNVHGELGLENRRDIDSLTLFPFPENEKIKQFTGGNFHQLVLTKSRKIYGWGNNSEGQMGLGQTLDGGILNKNPLTGIPFPNDQCIESMIVESYHNLFLSESKEAYVCGLNDHGQLGVGDKENRYDLTPLTIPGETIKTLVTNARNTFVITESGKVYCCGNNEFGQLGTGDTNDRLTLTSLRIFSSALATWYKKPLREILAYFKLHRNEFPESFHTLSSMGRLSWIRSPLNQVPTRPPTFSFAQATQEINAAKLKNSSITYVDKSNHKQKETIGLIYKKSHVSTLVAKFDQQQKEQKHSAWQNQSEAKELKIKVRFPFRSTN